MAIRVGEIYRLPDGTTRRVTRVAGPTVTVGKPIRGDSHSKAVLSSHARAAGLPLPVFEFRFHPARRWQIDAAWPDAKLAVEIEGGAFVSGRHTRGATFRKDCEKYAELAIAGWTLIRVMPEHVKSGQALDWIDRWFKARRSTT